MSGANRYIPLSDDDRAAMLRDIGVDSIEELFSSIPTGLRLQGDLDIPGPLSEMDLIGELTARAGENTAFDPRAQFLGGGAYETARYDLKTLKCLNTPRHAVTSQYRTAFYPYYPDYGKYVSLDHTCADGNLLCHDVSYEGSMFGNLSLQAPQMVSDLPAGASRFIQRANGYVATIKAGTTTFRDGEDQGARPGNLLRGER